VSHSSS